LIFDTVYEAKYLRLFDLTLAERCLLIFWNQSFPVEILGRYTKRVTSGVSAAPVIGIMTENV
jgi:hypothetical protein